MNCAFVSPESSESNLW